MTFSILETLSHLPENQKKIFIWKHYCGWPVEKIAGHPEMQHHRSRGHAALDSSRSFAKGRRAAVVICRKSACSQLAMVKEIREGRPSGRSAGANSTQIQLTRRLPLSPSKCNPSRFFENLKSLRCPQSRMSDSITGNCAFCKIIRGEMEGDSVLRMTSQLLFWINARYFPGIVCWCPGNITPP